MELVLPPIAGVEVSASALVALPDDPAAWVTGLAGTGGQVIETTTRTGWPLRIVIARVDEVWQAHAFYTFFEHVAVAVVLAADREAIERALPLLAEGTPRWTSGVAALAELWS